MKMTIKTTYDQMLGHESKILNRHSKTTPMGKVQLQSYPEVSNGAIIKDSYIMQLNCGGSMNQGGMKRNGNDGIKNWPSTAVHYLMKKGFKFDKKGNCYFESNKVNNSNFVEMETRYLQTMVNLQKHL